MRGTNKHTETYMIRFDPHKVFHNKKRINVYEHTKDGAQLFSPD